MNLMHVFFDVSMSNGHAGLTGLLKKKKSAMEDGYAVFINKRWTALKMTTPANIVLHLKATSKRPIDPNTIKYLPNCVNGSNLNYAKALEQALLSDYRTKLERRK